MMRTGAKARWKANTTQGPTRGVVHAAIRQVASEVQLNHQQ